MISVTGNPRMPMTAALKWPLTQSDELRESGDRERQEEWMVPNVMWNMNDTFMAAGRGRQLHWTTGLERCGRDRCPVF